MQQSISFRYEDYELSDDEFVSLDFEISFDLTGYHPPVMNLSNGDPGYPGEGVGVEDMKSNLIAIVTPNVRRQPTVDEKVKIENWFDKELYRNAEYYQGICLRGI
jgi:hypothetical protein